MKATSSVVNVKYISCDWESMREYNEANDTYRCRVLFSEVSTSEGTSNKALAFLQRVTSNNLCAVVVNLDSEEYGKTEDEKTATLEGEIKGEVIPLTIVSVALDKTYYTPTGIPVDVRKIAYIGTGDFEAQAVASISRKIAKQLENDELSEEDPTKMDDTKPKRSR